MKNNDLRSRMVALMESLCASYGRYKWLEVRTGVPAQRWANLYNLRQQPTVELVEALGKLAPSSIEWLVTGEALNLQIALDDPHSAFKQVVWLEKRDELKLAADRMEKELHSAEGKVGA